MNNTKFLKFGIAVLLGAGVAGFLYAQLDIPTDINNAIQTIKEIRVTSDGTQAGTTLVRINGAGADAALQVAGSISMGTITGAQTNKVVGDRSSVLGGYQNDVNGNTSVIAGGKTNKITGYTSVIGGGERNTANGSTSVIAGGVDNTITGSYSTIPGGQLNNVNASNSFAAGKNTQVNNQGTFIWSDNSTYMPPSPAIFSSSRDYTFLIRARNGVGINTGTTTPGYDLTVQGSGIVYGNLKTNNMIAGAYYYGSITGNDLSYELDLSQWEGTTGDIYYASGYVGIGTTTPTAQLHANGTVRLQGLGTSTQTSALVIDANGNVGTRVLNTIAFGGYSETDPTVNALAKTVLGCTANQIVKYNGTAWACATDAGLTTETDPTVNTLAKTALSCSANQIPKYNGTTWACVADAGLTAESDPQVGTLTNGRWCTTDGTTVNCTTTAPITTETDPLVNSLGKAGLSCAANQIPKFNGTAWTCTADAGITTESDPTVNALAKTTLSCSANQIAKFNGTAWICSSDVGLTAEIDPKIGTLTAGKWCTTNGSTVNCSSDIPSPVEIDPTAVKLTTNQTIAGLKTFTSNITIAPTATNRIYMGGAAGGNFGIAYDSSNPNYGIFYTEGSPDYVSIAPNGNITSPAMKIDGNGDAIINNYWFFHRGNEFNANGLLYLNYRNPVTNDPATAGNTSINTNGGNVGIGTASPVNKLHVNGSTLISNGMLEIYNNDADNQIRFHDPSDVWYSIGTDRSDSGKFKIGYGSAVGDSEGITLYNGNVGIGTTTPIGVLDVRSPWDSGKYLLALSTSENTTSTPNRFYVKADGDAYLVGYLGIGMTEFTDGAGLNVNGPTLLSGTVNIRGSVTAQAFYYSSDESLKKDLTKISNPLEKIIALNGYYFTWKKDNTKDIGVVAQDVEKVFPDAVKTDDKGLKSVKYGNLIAPVIEAIKELYTKYLDQQDQISKLQQRIEALEKSLDK